MKFEITGRGLLVAGLIMFSSYNQYQREARERANLAEEMKQLSAVHNYTNYSQFYGKTSPFLSMSGYYAALAPRPLPSNDLIRISPAARLHAIASGGLLHAGLEPLHFNPALPASGFPPLRTGAPSTEAAPVN